MTMKARRSLPTLGATGMWLHCPHDERNGAFFRDEQVKVNSSRISEQRCNIHAASYSDLQLSLHQKCGRTQLLAEQRQPEIDHLVDSVPVMMAAGGHAYTARVARDVAAVGYCASKRTYFHGVRLHAVAQRRNGRLPLPAHIWLREASVPDLESIRQQDIDLPHSSLIGDKAYLDPTLQARLEAQQTTLYAPKKKPKGKELSATDKYYNRLVSRLRQPIESFFNWLIDKTDIQRAGTVRSTDGLMVHCFGKLTVAFYLLVFNP
jgi:Transposase DDE domain